MTQIPEAFWSLPASELLHQLQTTPQGLSDDEAIHRLTRYGPNLLKPKKRTYSFVLLLAQFMSPITLLLLFAAGLSFFLHDPADALIILAIVFVSGLLGFWQERGAANAIERLLAVVQIKAVVLRDGSPKEIHVEEIVPGDVVVLSAGGNIPGDCLILESKDLFVDESALTGETYPAEKEVGIISLETPLSQRTNILFMGTHVVSGNTYDCRSDGRLPLHPPCRTLWLPAAADALSFRIAGDRGTIYLCSGDGEAGLLQKGEVLILAIS
jgi:Mg2+-importing ATPase